MTKAEIQLVRSLADKRGRTESGLFVAEGAKLISELRASHKLSGSCAPPPCASARYSPWKGFSRAAKSKPCLRVKWSGSRC